MTRALTQRQQDVLHDLQAGYRWTRLGLTPDSIRVLSSNHSRDGDDLVCHRVVLENPRTTQTQMFRVTPDGHVRGV